MSFDIAFFSFNRDQDLLIPGLKSVIKNVPDYNEIILVWDDYIRERPVDFDQLQEDIQHKLRVIKHSELYSWPNSIGQWGWIKQQLAKLLCFNYSQADYTWICDGDVLITGDPELFYNGMPCLRYDSHQLQERCYVPFMEKYFGLAQQFTHSFVGSTALFDNKICREMWEHCVSTHGKSLVDCVKEFIDSNPSNQHPFSEFATYGNYCYTHYRDKFFVATHNWNYVPKKKVSNMPIQIMWNQAHPDLEQAERIVTGETHVNN